MDSLSLWLAISFILGGVSSWLALALLMTRKRAVRAEQLVDQLLSERMVVAATPPTGQAIDAIAETVERIAEGQRFLNRALTERSREGDGAGRGAPKYVTPH